MDKNYCYIDDVLSQKKGKEEKFDPEKYDFKNDTSLDPDMYSPKLYEDLAAVFSGRKIGDTGKTFLCFSENNKEYVLQGKFEENADYTQFGSDYIGPSINWAYNKLQFADNKCGAILKQARTLGGHTFWIRKTGSINQRKGGKGIYDRIDLTLDEIKNAYDKQFACGNANAKHSDGLYQEICIEQEFFQTFENFKNFIDFFFFQDFMTPKYEVISLSLSDKKIVTIAEEDGKIKECGNVNLENNCYLPGHQLGKTLNDEERKNAYQQYVDNCLYRIEKRTQRMLNSISTRKKAVFSPSI